jgi:sugar phosphate isomerase/epimerase
MREMDLLYVSSTFFLDDSTIEQVLDICENEGIFNIELGSNHSYAPDPAKKVMRGKFSCLVHNYFPAPEERFVLNIASLDETVHSRSIKFIRHAIDYCAQIRAPLYTFHPGFLTDPDTTEKDPCLYDFHFLGQRLKGADYEKAYLRMLDSVSIIVQYARQRQVFVAMETQGSTGKKEHLLMQRPEEYQRLFKRFLPKELGINLNIGHLNLASRAFGFQKEDFVDVVADYVVAMEMSHNNGISDQHLPLQPDSWYWPLIFDRRFKDAYKIMEYRDIPADKVKENMRLFINNMSHGF